MATPSRNDPIRSTVDAADATDTDTDAAAVRIQKSKRGDPPAPFHPNATRRFKEQPESQEETNEVVENDNLPQENEQQQQRQLVGKTAAVRVGVGVVLVNPVSSCIWCGVRKSSHGANKLALPGGHLEVGESWEQCGIREVEEETGILMNELQFLNVTNDIMIEDEAATTTSVTKESGSASATTKHYVTIFMIGVTEEIPQNMEPHKCMGWDAYTMQQLLEKDGQDLFLPLQHLLQQTSLQNALCWST